MAQVLCEAMQGAVSPHVGKVVRFSTLSGSRQGVILSAKYNGFTWRVKVRDNRGKSVRRSQTVTWSELTQSQRLKLLSGTKIVRHFSDQDIALAYLAIWNDDTARAKAQLEKGRDHPLVPHLRRRLGLAPAEPRKVAPPGKPRYARQHEPGTTGPKRQEPAEKLQVPVDDALRRGMDWLVDNQGGHGNWSVKRLGGNLSEDAAVGLTGLATLALLRGSVALGDDSYMRDVESGADFLMAKQDRRGKIGENTGFTVGGGYNHAIAALALAEVALANNDAAVRRAVRRAVGYSLRDHQKELSGWRYQPRSAPDTAVTVWFVQHLARAADCGFEEAIQGFAGAEAWFGKIMLAGPDREQPGFMACYQPGRAESLRLTAAVVLARIRMGWRLDEPAVIEGVGQLVSNIPEGTAPAAVDYYGAFYMTEAVWVFGGPAWATWRDGVSRHLVEIQDDEGAWPLAGYGKQAGAAYTTSMSCLALARCAP